jgi:hypothetical protein
MRLKFLDGLSSKKGQQVKPLADLFSPFPSFGKGETQGGWVSKYFFISIIYQGDPLRCGNQEQFPFLSATSIER